MTGRDLVAFTSKISEVTTDHDKNTASLMNTDILQQLKKENPRYMNDHALIDYTMLITELYESNITHSNVLYRALFQGLPMSSFRSLAEMKG